MLVDTHCHIQEAGYPLDVGDTMARAHHAGVSKLICVGTNDRTSEEAVHFAKNHENVWASIGVHPHDAKDGWDNILKLLQGTSAQHELQGEERTLEFTSKVQAEGRTPPKKSGVIAIGEIGLDYFYTHSPREVQIAAFEAQLQLAVDHKLPVIFHVRDASSAERRSSVWNDFWPIFDNFQSLKGVLHSFTDNAANLEKALNRELFIGLNGISTFTKDDSQRQVFDNVPLDNLLFETDAPFLTPAPHRGTVNEPAYVRVIATYHAERRRISLEEIAARTTKNATSLFAI